MTPTEVEKTAMEHVFWYERERGATPVDVSTKGIGYDIDSGDRLIEVKGFRNERYPVISLYKLLPEQLGDDINRYYIYIVYDVEKEPKVKILTPSMVYQHLELDTRYIIRGRWYRSLHDSEPADDLGDELPKTIPEAIECFLSQHLTESDTEIIENATPERLDWLHSNFSRTLDLICKFEDNPFLREACGGKDLSAHEASRALMEHIWRYCQTGVMPKP